MSVLVNTKRCTGCSRCVMRCPVDAMRVWAGTCVIEDHCIDCDICILYCPADAIKGTHSNGSARRVGVAN